MCLKYAHKSSKRDLDIVKAAVIQNGLALKYAHSVREGPRNCDGCREPERAGPEYAHNSSERDLEIDKAAVIQNGLALKHAHKSAQRDPDIVTTAVI